MRSVVEVSASFSAISSKCREAGSSATHAMLGAVIAALHHLPHCFEKREAAKARGKLSARRTARVFRDRNTGGGGCCKSGLRNHRSRVGPIPRWIFLPDAPRGVPGDVVFPRSLRRWPGFAAGFVRSKAGNIPR